MGRDLRRRNFLPFFVCLADLNILCSGLFSLSHQIKFYRFITTHKTSTRVVFVNGKHPWILRVCNDFKKSPVPCNLK